MKKNSNKMAIKRMAGFFLALGFLVFLSSFHFSDETECQEYTGYVSENFDTDEFKDQTNSSVYNWPPGPISLNHLGANFEIDAPAGMGAQIYVCDQGDLDGDGMPDLIGLDISNNNRLILIRNMYEDADGDSIDDDGIIYLIDPSEVYDEGMSCGPASITTGDYNNDGLVDFFFMKNNNDSFEYSGFVAAMYINRGTTDNPDFGAYNESPNLNFYNKFDEAGIYINWAADHLCSVDIDKDGDTDILAISQDKIFLVRNPGIENFDLASFQVGEISYDLSTGFVTGRGGSSIDAGDFDGDGDVDIIGGTVQDYNYLVYYTNDGTGNFIRNEILIPDDRCTGTVATCVADFNQDGTLDIFGATDRWNAGNEARMWIMLNNGTLPIPGDEDADPMLDITFRCLNGCLPILPDPHDVDMSACTDFDQDGDMDVILADANHSGDYYLNRNEIASVYTLAGEARSLTMVDSLDAEKYAVTKTRISYLEMGTSAGSNTGLSIAIYLSNDGTNWEYYTSFTEDDIHTYSNLPEHTFEHFGSQLYWKAMLSASEDSMDEFDEASYETPLIYQIQMEYTFVERREYSRSSVVATITDNNGDDTKLIIGASFYYPGWQGQLRAYDLTKMTPENNSYANLRTITTSDPTSPTGRKIIAEDVEIFWDAGQLLADRSPASRTIYTAIQEQINAKLNRMDFTAANAGTLGSLLQDPNNDNAGLLNFIRGEGRSWKLGDINHSNPIVVGPPAEDPVKMGDGYTEFASTWVDRTKYLYVGANDGMIHCFDLATGEEHWAFIPFNLLPKLKNMWAISQVNQDRYFNRDIYVDATPVAADVFIDTEGGNNREWRTLLIFGQGHGQGSTVAGGKTGNFYVALDITDPDNPQPLWEFTHSRMGATYSVPTIGKVRRNKTDRWAAFMGSGYDNVNKMGVQGNRFFAILLDEGIEFWGFNIIEVNTKNRWSQKTNIVRCLPGSPSSLDIDSDGYLDRVYIGDLDGRLYQISVDSPGKDQSEVKERTLYTDKKNYPIITKPAIWIDPVMEDASPHIYFGTGGDDKAPADATYSFISLLDEGDNGKVEWFLGDPDILDLEVDLDRGDLFEGEKVWADPQITNNIIFFSTLEGSIESVDPCENLSGAGRLYGRYVKSTVGGNVGTTSITNMLGKVENLTLAIKTRSAVTLGETERTATGARKKEIYIQEYDSTIQKLEMPVGALLKIRSWREVYSTVRIKK